MRPILTTYSLVLHDDLGSLETLQEIRCAHSFAKKPNLVHITASAQSNICLIALDLLDDNRKLFRVIGRQWDRFDDIIVRSLEEKASMPELSID